MSNHSICIIAPEKNAYSETFIRNHIEWMPAKVHGLWGFDHLYKDNGKPLVPPFGLLKRTFNFMRRKLLRYKNSGDAAFCHAFRQFVREHKIEAVLAEYGPTGYAVRKACAEANVPLAVHFHGYDAYEDATLIKYNRYKDLFRTAQAFISVSKHMKQQLVELGAPLNKLKYIPCGVDTAKFSGAKPECAPPLFVTVGRFANKKAPHLTLLSFKKALIKVPDAKLIMYGTGELYEACLQLTKALDITHAVSFKGIKSPEEVALGMKEARGFVQHSLQTTDGNCEGTPVAILEACASGLPVASTRHGGISDVIVDGETGLLVNEGDIEGMAANIVRLAEDPYYAARLGRRAQERVGSQFSIERSIRSLYDVICSMITDRKTPAAPHGDYPNSLDEYFLLEPLIAR